MGMGAEMLAPETDDLDDLDERDEMSECEGRALSRMSVCFSASLVLSSLPLMLLARDQRVFFREVGCGSWCE